MTFATVNVLPEPVTPSSVWCARPDSQPVDQLRDRLRLVARRLVVAGQFEVVRLSRHASICGHELRQSDIDLVARRLPQPIESECLESRRIREWSRESTSFKTRPARQALPHRRAHGPRRAAQGGRQGHHRPRRRRARFRHARRTSRKPASKRFARASRATRPSKAPPISRTRSSRSSSARTGSTTSAVRSWSRPARSRRSST